MQCNDLHPSFETHCGAPEMYVTVYLLSLQIYNNKKWDFIISFYWFSIPIPIIIFMKKIEKYVKNSQTEF